MKRLVQSAMLLSTMLASDKVRHLSDCLSLVFRPLRRETQSEVLDLLNARQCEDIDMKFLLVRSSR